MRDPITYNPWEIPVVLPPIPDITSEEYDLDSSPIHFVPRDEEKTQISDSIPKTLAEVLFNLEKSIAVPIHLLTASPSPTEEVDEIFDDVDVIENEVLVTPYNASHWKKQIREAMPPPHELFGNEDPSIKNYNPPRARTEHAVAIPPGNFIFRHIFNDVCLHQEFKLQQLEVLSVTNPTWAARIFLSRKDVSARRVVDGLAVTRCQQVTANHTFENHEVNGTCYTMTPVLIGVQLWFVLPGTTDLIESSPTTICPYPNRVLTIPAQRLPPPNTRTNQAAKAFLFNSPGTFFSTVDFSAMAPGPHIARLQQNQQEISNRLSKRGILENTWLAVKNTTLKARQSLSNLYENTTNKLSEGVETFKRSILRLVLWIVVPTLVVIILIGCCVIYLKLYLLRRATTTASSALFEVARNFAPRSRNRSRNNRAVNIVRSPSPNGTEMESPLFVPRIYAMRNSTNSSLPYNELTIGKTSTDVTALIDSGASISYMKLSTLHEVTPATSFLPRNTTATTANGTTIQLLACVKLPIRIGRYTISHQFWISAVKDCPAQLLLGSDFIRQLNRSGLPLSLDLHNHVIAIGEEHHNLVQVHNITVQTETPLHVLIDGDTVLPRRTTAVIRTKIRGLPPHAAMDVLIEDNQRVTDDLYVVGRALVSPSTDGTCYINIMNPSNTNIYIKVKTKIAKATPVAYPEVQVLAVHQQPPDHTVHNPANAVPPEADWEARLPHFPVYPPPKNFDIAAEIDLSASALNEEQKQQLCIILRYHTDAFVGPDGHLGHYKGDIRHRIDLIDNAPIPARKIYRVPLEKRKEIEKQITQMLSDGIIRESSSPFCAPIVLVKKRETNAWRFTIDFRGLNAITKPQQSILPNIQDIIDLCANQCLYTSLDFQQRFHQIPLEESHCERLIRMLSWSIRIYTDAYGIERCSRYLPTHNGRLQEAPTSPSVYLHRRSHHHLRNSRRSSS